ncbi:FAD-binding Berberine family protein [Striga hermonthica]|uniref:FAD-binding Berberine family protein n=1 Tax=Striga hermonthica TaxID=68872 RepID=A0A9N7NK89_STRHE|nr:FAD-binding Berberine family protein [Striga hermonthica]
MASLSTTNLTSLVLASLLVLGASSSRHNTDFLECLTDQFERSNSATDVIFTPQNASYASLLVTENLRPASTSPERPSLIITPFHESEIQAAIFCSKKVGMQIRVRSGGHDYEGLSYTSRNPFVVLDMRNFRSVWIEDNEKTAWVQVGATLGQLYHTLARRSKTLAVSAGTCPTVGVGGLFSGGGYGMMSRRHSIAADQIVDAILIDADGRILNRKSMGDDLFWAVRGGGGVSFGIIMAYKVNLVAVPETVTVFNVTRTLEENATRLVHRWQYVADKLDRNLLIRLSLRSVRSTTSQNRTIRAIFFALYLGPVSDLMALMQNEFPELGLVERDYIEMSWIESILYFQSLYGQPIDVLLSRTPRATMYIKAKSDFVTQPIPINGLRGIWRFLHEEAENMAEVQFSPWGGAMDDLSESETPFPHRAGNIFMIHYMVTWVRPGNEELQRHLDWIRRLYAYMAPYVTTSPRSAYFNYKDLDLGSNNPGNTSYEQASMWGRRYFKGNFDRLVRVKSKFDPSNFFRNEQSIPPVRAR